MKRALAMAGAAILMAAPAAGQDKPIKIGFVSTFSGPAAVMGNDMRNAFELALDHMGRKMAAGRSKSSTKTMRRSRMSASRRPRS